MHPLSIIALVAIATLYGILWHNQPAREPMREAGKTKTPVPPSTKARGKLGKWRRRPAGSPATAPVPGMPAQSGTLNR